MLRVFTISRPSLEELLKDVLKKKKDPRKMTWDLKKKKEWWAKKIVHMWEIRNKLYVENNNNLW